MKFLRISVAALVFLASSVAQGPVHYTTLTWLWSQGTGDPATGYYVYKSLVSGSYTSTNRIANLTGTTTKTYTDNNVTAGQTVYYVITAYNPGGESVRSNEVTCTTPFQAPEATSGLSAVVK